MKVFDFFLKRRSVDQNIKLYSFYTPSHQILSNGWFLPTLQDDYEIILKFFDQECTSARYMDQGWTSTIMHKVELCIRAVQENWNKVFLYSDVDVQFFKPTEKFLTKLMEDNDLMIQRDTPWGGACAGFMVCQGNDKTLKLFKEIKFRIGNDPRRSDQAYLNEILLNEGNDMKWKYLPVEFFGGGTLTGTLWEPGLPLTVPENIFVHHANWTVGVSNKIAQLSYVRKIVEERKHSSKLHQKLS